MSWKGESELDVNNFVGTAVGLVQRIHRNTELWTQFDGEPMEFEWNIFPGFTTLQLPDKIQKFMNKMGDPAQFQRRIIIMSMFNDIICGINDKKRNVLIIPHLCS